MSADQHAARLLESEALKYDGDEVVYSGRHVANILETQATRIRLIASDTPVDGHGYTGEFTEKEFYERAFDHEKAAKNGMAAGPNVSYVRTFLACARALRMAAPLLPKSAAG